MQAQESFPLANVPHGRPGRRRPALLLAISNVPDEYLQSPPAFLQYLNEFMWSMGLWYEIPLKAMLSTEFPVTYVKRIDDRVHDHLSGTSWMLAKCRSSEICIQLQRSSFLLSEELGQPVNVDIYDGDECFDEGLDPPESSQKEANDTTMAPGEAAIEAAEVARVVALFLKEKLAADRWPNSLGGLVQLISGMPDFLHKPMGVIERASHQTLTWYHSKELVTVSAGSVIGKSLGECSVPLFFKWDVDSLGSYATSAGSTSVNEHWQNPASIITAEPPLRLPDEPSQLTPSENATSSTVPTPPWTGSKPLTPTDATSPIKDSLLLGAPPAKVSGGKVHVFSSEENHSLYDSICSKMDPEQNGEPRQHSAAERMLRPSTFSPSHPLYGSMSGPALGMTGGSDRPVRNEQHDDPQRRSTEAISIKLLRKAQVLTNLADRLKPELLANFGSQSLGATINQIRLGIVVVASDLGTMANRVVSLEQELLSLKARGAGQTANKDSGRGAQENLQPYSGGEVIYGSVFV
jgi:hypothetical protein